MTQWNINADNHKLMYGEIQRNINAVMNCESKKWPLYKCSAYVKTDGVNWVLISYATPIALFTPSDASVWDCLRVCYGYTSTSNQHVHKFIKWLEQKGYTVNVLRRFTK